MICNEYARKDSRIRVFHKENGGVSSARNVGLDNAKGEWVVFVDSDDWVDEHYLEILYQDGKYDFVTCYWNILNCDFFVSEIPNSREFVGLSNVTSFLDENINRISCPVCRLYKKKIITENKIHFDQRVSLAEDALFNIIYLQNVKSIRQTSDVLYNYEKHVGSLSNIVIPWNQLDYVIRRIGEEICRLEEILSWNGEDLYQHYIWGLLLRRHLTHLQYDKSIYQCKDGLRQVYSNKHVKKVISKANKRKSKFRKLFDYLMMKNLFLFSAILLKSQCFLYKRGIIKPR